MTESVPASIESMLRRLGDRPGRDPAAAAALHPLIQTELSAIVAAQQQPRPVASLLREAFARLVTADDLGDDARARFFAVGARAMRRVLVDGTGTRVGGAPPVLPLLALDEVFGHGSGEGQDVMAVDDAVTSLRMLDTRAGRVAELRLFGGLTFYEIEIALGLPRRDVADDWAMARIWLGRALRADRG